jgi:hypothetical protein
MAEDDNKGLTKSLKESKQALEEFEAAQRRFSENNDLFYEEMATQLEKVRELTALQIEARKEAVEELKMSGEQEIEVAQKRLEDPTITEATRANIENLKSYYEERNELFGSIKELGQKESEELEKYAKAKEEALKGDNLNIFPGEGVLKGLVNTGEEVVTATLVFRTLGVEIGNAGSMFRNITKDMDDARRKLIPFTGGVSDATELQKSLAVQSTKTFMSVSKLSESAVKAGQSFKMFGRLTAEQQGELVAFTAQMEALGVTGAENVIESLITEGGVKSIKEATAIFKGLTTQMEELGVTPQQFKQDFDKLIPTMGIFGSSARSAIGSISAVAAQARVDVGSITAFADNFSGYRDAQKAAQTINAIFQKPIIRDPAELVRIFFTEGPAAVTAYVQNKVLDATGGIDLDTARGRAEAFALQKAVKMGDLTTKAFAKGSERLTTESAQALTDAAPGSPDAAAADRKAIESLPIQERAEAVFESFAIKMAKNMGAELGSVGKLLESSLLKGANAISGLVDKIVEVTPDEMRKSIQESIDKDTTSEKFFPKVGDIIDTTSQTKDVSSLSLMMREHQMALGKARSKQQLATGMALSSMALPEATQLMAQVAPENVAAFDDRFTAVYASATEQGSEKVFQELVKVNDKLQALNQSMEKPVNTAATQPPQGMEVTLKVSERKSFNAYVSDVAYNGIQDKLDRHPRSMRG